MAYPSRPATADDRRHRDAQRLVDDIAEAAADHRLDGLLPSLRQVEGPDRTGTISCAVDSAGRFLDVFIASDWRHTLATDALGAALLEAFEYAQSKAGVITLLLRRHGVEFSRQPHTVHAPVETPLPSPDAPDYFDAVQAKMRDAWRILDDVDARVADYREAREAVATGTYGILRGTIRGGHVVRIDVDGYAADHATPDMLAADARAVLSRRDSQHG